MCQFQICKDQLCSLPHLVDTHDKQKNKTKILVKKTSDGDDFYQVPDVELNKFKDMDLIYIVKKIKVMYGCFKNKNRKTLNRK